MRVMKHRNFRVIVWPRNPSDFGIASVGNLAGPRSEAEERRICEKIARKINRHLSFSEDDRGDVRVVSDAAPECSNCNSKWTEKSETYNGGCCAEDEKANPNPDTEPDGPGRVA